MQSPALIVEKLIYNSLIKNLQPEQADLTASTWADNNRLLSSRASSEPGRWRTSRTPYLREILDRLSIGDPCDTIVFMKAAQIGATEAGNNWLGYIVDTCPGPTMMVQPTVDMVKRLSKQRLDPMFTDTPVLAEKVTEKKSRESSNTMFIKEFPGGMLLLAGANSPTGLRSAPMRYLFLDEVDAYPEDCGGEGSPIKLAEARTRTFKRNRKIFIVSTPTVKGHSQIEKTFLETDQCYYHVPCPHCDCKQKLSFENLRWEKGRYETVIYICEHCGSGIEEGYKNVMLANGEWIATAVSKDKKTHGYHLNALYSPLGWFSWSDIAAEWEEAQGNVLQLKYFVNTVLGETWQEKGEAPEWERLYRRREEYPLNVIPAEAGVLTAGVDVQKDRLEVEIVAWGSRMRSWSIGYRILKGDTTQDEVWETLDRLLDEQFEHELGTRLQIRMLAVDSGNNTQRVYHWVRSIGNHRVMAIKGFYRDINTYMVGQPTQVDINYRGKKVYRGTKLWPVYVNMIKEELFSWLTLEPALDEEPEPSGFCHFPAYDREYFQQLCSEQKIKKTRGGIGYYTWEKMRERNEALDCRIYARAAANVLQLDKMNDENWDKLLNGIRDQVLRETQNTGYNGTRQRKSSEFWS